MKKFSIRNARGFFPYALFTCRGDESNMCNKCKVKFLCYTGELPVEALKGKHDRLDENVEEFLFGSKDIYLVEYDFEKHYNDYSVNIFSRRRTGERVKFKGDVEGTRLYLAGTPRI